MEAYYVGAVNLLKYTDLSLKVGLRALRYFAEFDDLASGPLWIFAAVIAISRQDHRAELAFAKLAISQSVLADIFMRFGQVVSSLHYFNGIVKI